MRAEAFAPSVGAMGDTRVERRGLALLATSLGYAVVQLDVSVVNVAIKPIGAEFAAPVSGLQWVVNAYTLVFAALILTAGALGDRVGAKRVFCAGFGLFTAASVACAGAVNLDMLIASRVVQGIGAAILVPCSLSLLNHAYPQARDRARAVGLWAAGASVALSAGPLVGGLLIASLGWRWIFIINVPIGLAAIWLTARYSTETTRSTDRAIDIPGQIAAFVALFALAAATVGGGQRGFADTWVLAGYAGAAVAAASFIVVERRRSSPMLPLGLFSSRVFSSASAIGLVLNIAFYGLIFVLSLYFQTTRGYSALMTGLAFGPTTAAVLVANLNAGRLAARFGERTVLVGGALLMALSLAALLPLGAHTAFAAIAVQLTVLGFGLGLVVPVMTSELLGSVDRKLSGIAAGTLNTARQVGSTIGVALFGSLAAVNLVAGMHRAIAISIALSVVTAALGVVAADPHPAAVGSGAKTS
jgi:MFS transporter, DHA2 family, methylenomycin A resistance protein